MDIHKRIGMLPRILDVKNLHQLALNINLSSQAVANCANGRSKPSFSMIKKICDLYPALNARWLLTGEGKPLYDVDKDISISESNELQSHIDHINEKFEALKERVRRLEKK